MKTILVYLLGFLTPPVLVMLALAFGDFMDWRERRRYKRAWDKFSAEFDQITPERLAECRAKWAKESYTYGPYCDDRSRYFAMRWQYGHTTEV